MSKRRELGLGLGVALGVAALILQSSGAMAHPLSWYRGEWDVTPDNSKNFRFTGNFPSGSGQRDSVLQGAIQWNNVPNAIFVWNEIAEVGQWNVSSNCGATWNNGNGNNTINWKPIPVTLAPDPLASTLACVNANGFITKFWMKFNSDYGGDWHWSGSTPDDVPNGKFDGWAVASHEFGHAVGFDGPYENGHLDPDGTLCDDDLDMHTMCPFIPDGIARQRTLEVHDTDTFMDIY